MDHASTPPRRPLVGLLGASFNTGNLGVSALLSGTTSSVRRGFPRARLVLFDYAQRPAICTDRINGGSLPLELVNLRFSKWAWLPNNIARLLFFAFLLRLIPVPAWRRWIARRSKWLRRIVEPDFHLSLAGGDSFSDIYGLRRLAYVALPQILVLALERPLILLPQTYGPFRTRMARAIARGILRRAKAIYSRDHESLEVVRELLRGQGPQPRLAYDMGFGLEPLPPRPAVRERLGELKQKGPLVGFNVSGLLYLRNPLRHDRFGLKSDYRLLVRRLLDRFIEAHGAKVLLIPHVSGKAAAPESDFAACRQIAALLGKRYENGLHYLDGRFDHHETKHIIGECDFFCGSRMHACIAALSQCVPAVGLAYSRKFAGVMADVGSGAVVADLCALESEAVVATVDIAWRNREAMRRDLFERMPAIRRSALGLFLQPEFREFAPQGSA